MSAVKSFPKPHRDRLEGDEYRKFIRSIFIRDGWMCRRCRARDSLTLHHIVKRSQLGGDMPGNCISVCLLCHQQLELNKLKVEILDVVIKFHEERTE